MSNIKIFSIYDSKAEAFMQPFFLPTAGSAIRSFSDALLDEKSQFNKHAEDYSLFEIGEWDEVGGRVIPALAPRSLGTALELCVRKV